MVEKRKETRKEGQRETQTDMQEGKQREGRRQNEAEGGRREKHRRLIIPAQEGQETRTIPRSPPPPGEVVHEVRAHDAPSACTLARNVTHGTEPSTGGRTRAGSKGGSELRLTREGHGTSRPVTVPGALITSGGSCSCFPPWLCGPDKGVFIANTANCGPAARVPGMITSHCAEMNWSSSWGPGGFPRAVGTRMAGNTCTGCQPVPGSTDTA